MEMVRLTPEETRARKRRNAAIGWLLVAFCLLVFLITLAHLGGSVAERPF